MQATYYRIGSLVRWFDWQAYRWVNGRIVQVDATDRSAVMVQPDHGYLAVTYLPHWRSVESLQDREVN